MWQEVVKPLLVSQEVVKPLAVCLLWVSKFGAAAASIAVASMAYWACSPYAGQDTSGQASIKSSP
jgi:hypothetical protein